MQPFYESVAIPAERSCLIFDRQLPEFTFNWHYHPECELTLTVNSRGTRFVGDDVAPYGDGDLVLIGPNLPHAWQSHSLIDGALPHRAVVCWFSRDWAEGLGRLMPELRAVSRLLAEADRGVRFGAAIGARLREQLIGLCMLSPAEQVLGLQMLLSALAEADDRTTLASGPLALSELARDRRRMERVLAYLHAHFREPIRLEPLSALSHLSDSQLQRVFKRATHMSISAYVTRLRIGAACRMLAESDHGMGTIAAECGFYDGAQFSRVFAAFMGKTPSRYRADFRAPGPARPDGVFRMTERRRPLPR